MSARSIQGFNESRFQQNVNAALDRIRTILDNTRNPSEPSAVPHSYNDKYLLAEVLANSSVAGQLNCLEVLGVTPEILKQMKDWSKTRSVSLRFTSEETCEFLRTEEKEVESDTEYVTEVKGVFGTHKRTDKTVRTVIEHFWKFSVKYDLIAFQGNTPNQGVSLRSSSGTHEIKTSSKSTPKPKVSIISPIDLNISWLLDNLNSEMQTCFTIDRNQKTCNTPRRNSEVNSALSFFSSFISWSVKVQNYFNNRLFPTETKHGLDLTVINDNNIFIPVVPLFEENVPKKDQDAFKFLATVVPSGKPEEDVSVILPTGDVNQFLEEQRKSLQAKISELQKVLPPDTSLITSPSATIVVCLLHASQICQYYGDGVQYIEQMLWDQLVAAIGKEVGPPEFTSYMQYHNRKLFKPEFEPKKFCYAIRRPDHYPEGILSLEGKIAGSTAEPICSIVNQIQTVSPMKFSINASTTITFGGERFVHAWMAHTFSGASGIDLTLSARARQFSCFIMMIGTVVSADRFQPKHAIIIQNKDDLLIPLLLEQIPSAQTFRDTIDSLSEEQQRFARSFRSMQLASTLFGVCIIQIKPQLEKLLNIPNDSLTKEIQLTQDLLDLFITYQIPSDLISYAGDENWSTAQKIDKVKLHVAAMQEMIKKSKDEELLEAQNKAEYSNLTGSAPEAVVHSQPDYYQAYKAPLRKKSAGKSSGVTKKEEEEPETPTGMDFTKLPTLLDKNFETFDVDGAIHSTIIKTSSSWELTYKKSLLADTDTRHLGLKEQIVERQRAYDLLDALSRSGILNIDEASFHLVIATTHRFDRTLMETVIQENVNPIEKVERSMLIVSSTIQEEDPATLIKPDQLARVQKASPSLF